MTTTSSMATWPYYNLRRRYLDEFKLKCSHPILILDDPSLRLHSLTQSDQRAFPTIQLKLMDMR